MELLKIRGIDLDKLIEKKELRDDLVDLIEQFPEVIPITKTTSTNDKLKQKSRNLNIQDYFNHKKTSK